MAFVNVHSIPGVTVSVTYWNTVYQVVSPAVPLSLAGGVYSLPSPQVEWDRAVFEITSYGTVVLPVTGRITIVNALVGGPYNGKFDVATSTTYVSTVGYHVFDPDVPYSGSASASMDGGTPYFLCGHDSGSGGDWQQLDSLVLELDGTFTAPEFWQDFAGTFEDESLQKPSSYAIHPEVIGRPAVVGSTECYTIPDPPGPGGACQTTFCGAPDYDSGGGSGPAPGDIGVLVCVATDGRTCCYLTGASNLVYCS